MLQQGVRFKLFGYRLQAILVVHLYQLTKFGENATSNHLLFVHIPANTCPLQDKSLVLIPICCDKNPCSYPSYPLLDYIGKRTPLAQCQSLSTRLTSADQQCQLKKFILISRSGFLSKNQELRFFQAYNSICSGFSLYKLC